MKYMIPIIQLNIPIIQLNQLQNTTISFSDSIQYGIVKEYINNRSEVRVKWEEKSVGKKPYENKITDLELKVGGNFLYYPDHLPVLVECKHTIILYSKEKYFIEQILSPITENCYNS